MKKSLILLLLIPMVSFGDCYETKDEAFNVCLNQVFSEDMPQFVKDYYHDEAVYNIIHF